MVLHEFARLQAPQEEGHSEDIRRAWDDLTGEELKPRAVLEARQREIECIDKKHVWTKIPRSKATREGWKVTLKRGSEQSDLRSCSVGKKFNTGEMEGVFAVTPTPT